MDKVIIVPDLHGRTFWKTLIEKEPTYPIIFLGDYTDPYPQEDISEEDCYINFLNVIDFKAKYPDDITLLIGNHELHYFNSEFQCTRFSWEYYEKYNSLLEQGLKNNTFQLCKQIDKYLFIHAGILKGWYDSHKDKINSFDGTLENKLNNLFKDNKQIFNEIPFIRWGLHSYGSPVWADIREFANEETPFVEEIIQIVGHTQIKVAEPTFINNICVTDNRKVHCLQLSTGKFI